jgi:2-oxo-4-hydroxy-4-carboxy--5-ureidoimidazoline (OHCU) decarboxylase
VIAADSGALQPGAPDMAALNAASADDFGGAVAPLFEGAQGFLGRLAAARPFHSWDDLFDRAREIAHALPEPLQVELVDAHPRLGAPPASVSAMSFREQGYDRERAAGPAGTDRPLAAGALVSPFGDASPLAPQDDRELGEDAALECERARIAAKLDALNDAYERRFGFRYCVFVAGRPRVHLIPEMAAALGAERSAELRRAVDAVVDIARDRWRALGGGDAPREASA